MTVPQPLAGKGIVVTRPAHQAEGLASLIRSAGGNAILYPVIEIADVADGRPLQARIDRLAEFDIAIFISPNAVDKAMRLVIAARGAVPPHLAIAAIGAGGVRALARFGVGNVIAPAGRSDSEALLEMLPLGHVGGKRVIIFRGEGGRELLGDTLRARGALVEYAECYRRVRPAAAPVELLDAWRRGALDAVTVTSSEGLANLIEMTGGEGRRQLMSTPLFVPHPRIAQAARDRAVATVIVTGPDDEGIVEGLSSYFSARR